MEEEEKKVNWSSPESGYTKEIDYESIIDETQKLPFGVVPITWGDGTTTYSYKGNEYTNVNEIPAFIKGRNVTRYDWIDKAGEFAGNLIQSSPTLRTVLPPVAKGLSMLEMPGETNFATMVGDSAENWGIDRRIGETAGYLVYPGLGELKPPAKFLSQLDDILVNPSYGKLDMNWAENRMLMSKSDDALGDASKIVRKTTDEYKNLVRSGMERMGMKDDIFDIDLYNKKSNILEEIIDPIGGKLRKDGTRQLRKLGKRHWMEYFLSPQSLKGDFEALRKAGKVAADETWEGFLKKRGLTTQDIQAHHINPLYDSMHLFDGIKWGSDEYWDVVTTLIERGARPGVVQKGDSINNIIRTFGKSSLIETPHGIAHEFYRDVMPVFFSKNEVLKMKNSHKYRMQKTKRWAGIVNRSEEILLETHKAWKSLNPKTRMDFNELVETMSKYDDKGVIKGIHQKYQVKDIQELVKEVQYQDFMQRLQADDSLESWMLNVDKEFMVDIITGMSKKNLTRKWGKKYNLKKMGMKQLDLFLK